MISFTITRYAFVFYVFLAIFLIVVASMIIYNVCEEDRKSKLWKFAEKIACDRNGWFPRPSALAVLVIVGIILLVMFFYGTIGHDEKFSDRKFDTVAMVEQLQSEGTEVLIRGKANTIEIELVKSTNLFTNKETWYYYTDDTIYDDFRRTTE